MMNMMLGGALSASRAAAAQPTFKSVAGAPSVLMLAPLTHISGYAQLLLMLHISGKITFLSRWQVKDALELIEREKVRSLAGATPAMLLELIRASRADVDLSSLSNFHINGVALHASLISELRRAFPTATLSTGYGLTETCGSVCTLSGAELLDRPLSAGKVLPSVDVKLVDEQGSAVGDGEVGEIYIRGAMVMQGYWASPEQTSVVLNDRWVKTGDLGRLDDQGYLYVVDRHNDVLVHRGQRISSTAIERAATSIPSVSEATVLGVVFTTNVEAIYIAVVPWDRDSPAGSSLCEEVATSIHQQLPGVEVPFKVVLRRSFPRTPSGKIDRAALKQQLHLAPLQHTDRSAGSEMSRPTDEVLIEVP
jgi:long-chain acyl-CoA synthetase